MTDLNRLEDETNDETAAPAAPIVQRNEPEMSPETAPGAEGASGTTNGVRATEDDLVPNGGPQLGPDGLPRKKRRRGTRGGQRLKKPAGANGAIGAGGTAAGGRDDADDYDIVIVFVG
ncbi:MAG: hypothetical protein JWM72_379, partial [Actinomycetia bacterium]|nr:hypothetical protein [Actinomycetes bacterium]